MSKDRGPGRVCNHDECDDPIQCAWDFKEHAFYHNDPRRKDDPGYLPPEHWEGLGFPGVVQGAYYTFSHISDCTGEGCVECQQKYENENKCEGGTYKALTPTLLEMIRQLTDRVDNIELSLKPDTERLRNGLPIQEPVD